MFSSSTFLATSILGLRLLLGPPTTVCQFPAPDSMSAAAADSQPALRDSAQAYRASGVDSTGLAPDSLLPQAKDTTKPDTGTVSSEPRDSILNAACNGPVRPRVAQDLLVVVFTPQARARERTAAAQRVDGKLIGPVSSAKPGAYYLKVPSGGQEFRLRAAADRLIRLPQVQQVGSRACPALPRDTTRQSPPAPPKPAAPRLPDIPRGVQNRVDSEPEPLRRLLSRHQSRLYVTFREQLRVPGGILDASL